MMATLDLVSGSEALLEYLGRTALGHTVLLLVLFAVAKVLRRH